MTVTFRDLAGMDEFREAEALQREVWGEDDTPDPADLMMVIQHEGGLVAGAFREGRMLGYVFGFPTATPGVQHSHRLAVRAEARGLKLGVRLKWVQHDWCRDRGIGLVRWTFDPLRLTNATLNVATLGAEVGTYLPDYYGAMAGINAGTASDRLLAEWRVGSAGVAAAREGRGGPAAEAVVGRVPIPPDFEALRETDPGAAAEARAAMRAALTGAFARGERIAGLDRSRGEYLLVRGGGASELGR